MQCYQVEPGNTEGTFSVRGGFREDLPSAPIRSKVLGSYLVLSNSCLCDVDEGFGKSVWHLLGPVVTDAARDVSGSYLPENFCA